jgi:tripartite-type tricarboxylate transporter receptor subunit TctC
MLSVKHGVAVLAAAGVACAVSWSAAALAQAYPLKSIRLIMPFPPGGPTDFVGRVIAQHLTLALGQQVIVDNRPGAGGTIGAGAAAKSASDGYTLLFASTSTFSISPNLYSNPGYDPVKSFAPISQLVTAPFLVVVHPSVPARSVQELIKLAKARPGQLSYASGSSGTPPHIAGEMFKSAAGVDLLHVPYKGIASAIIDLLSGRAQVMFEQLLPLHPHIQSGKLRPLAVASSSRHPQLPELPTSAEAGLPGYEVTAWFGLAAPAGTAPDIIKRLNTEVLKALQIKEVRAGFSNQGLETSGSSPEEFAAFIASESVKWSRAVKASGAKVD